MARRPAIPIKILVPGSAQARTGRAQDKPGKMWQQRPGLLEEAGELKGPEISQLTEEEHRRQTQTRKVRKTYLEDSGKVALNLQSKRDSPELQGKTQQGHSIQGRPISILALHLGAQEVSRHRVKI